MSGKKEELKRAEWIRDRLLDAGLDSSYLVPTNQLLPPSYLVEDVLALNGADRDVDLTGITQTAAVHNVVATIYGSQEPGESINQFYLLNQLFLWICFHSLINELDLVDLDRSCSFLMILYYFLRNTFVFA